jgi:hypothetical protein
MGKLNIYEEASRCLLCQDAPCTKAHAFDAGWAGVFYKTICLQEIKEVSPRFDAMHNNATHLCRLVCPTGAIIPTKRVACLS